MPKPIHIFIFDDQADIKKQLTTHVRIAAMSNTHCRHVERCLIINQLKNCHHVEHFFGFLANGVRHMIMSVRHTAMGVRHVAII